MGSEPGKRGWGAAREGSGHKIPERGGLRSLSKAAPPDTPLQKGGKCMSLREHTSPLGCGQQRGCGPGPSAQRQVPRLCRKEDSGSTELPEKWGRQARTRRRGWGVGGLNPSPATSCCVNLKILTGSQVSPAK